MEMGTKNVHMHCPFRSIATGTGAQPLHSRGRTFCRFQDLLAVGQCRTLPCFYRLGWEAKGGGLHGIRIEQRRPGRVLTRMWYLYLREMKARDVMCLLYSCGATESTWNNALLDADFPSVSPMADIVSRLSPALGGLATCCPWLARKIDPEVSSLKNGLIQ